MGIWEVHDFFFAALWALLAAGIHRFAGWMKEQIEQDDTISDKEAKFCRYGLLVLRWMVFFSVVCSVGTVALPLLDALLIVLLDTAVALFNKIIGIAFVAAIGIYMLKNLMKYFLENLLPKKAIDATTVTEVDIELARQAAMDMQGYAMNLMFRVLSAISPFTPVTRPRDTHDIEVRSTDGSSFYMKDNIVIYQVEAEVEGEITPEVEDTIQREAQRYAQKYIVDYPMLISPEAGGRAPVEVLSVKNCGRRVLIDYVFTSAKSFDLIDARRRARIDRQMKQERTTTYTDPDYGE